MVDRVCRGVMMSRSQSGLSLKDLQHAVQHLPVLGGDAAEALDPLPIRRSSCTRGHILMASGRVPKTLMIRSFSIYFSSVFPSSSGLSAG